MSQLLSRKRLGLLFASMVGLLLIWQFAAGLKEMVATNQRYTLQLHEDTLKLQEEIQRLHREDQAGLESVRQGQQEALKDASRRLEENLNHATDAMKRNVAVSPDLLGSLHQEFVQVGITLRDELANASEAQSLSEIATHFALLQYSFEASLAELERHLDQASGAQFELVSGLVDGLRLLEAQMDTLTEAVGGPQDRGITARIKKDKVDIDVYDDEDDEEIIEEIQDPCVAEAVDDLYIYDDSWQFDERLDLIDVSTLTTPESPDDVFVTSPQELFEEDPAATLIYRLGFPSTSSTNTRQRIAQGGRLPVEKRIPSCARPKITGCSGRFPNRQEALDRLRLYAGNVTTLPDTGQHMSLERKIAENKRRAAKDGGFHTDTLLGVTMLRDPAQYANRVFSDRQPTGKDFEEEKQLLNVRTVSHNILHFDWSFEERTQCSLLDASIDQWIDLADWRWNYFTRGLADNYGHTLWVRFLTDSRISREEAWRLNEEGKNSPLLAKAIETLHSFDFFGIYDRIEESMELMFFTFCWDSESMGFEFIPPSRAMKDARAHLSRGSDILPDRAFEIMRSRNRLDYLLFDYAERLFDIRIEAMRQAKENGYVCKLADSACGLTC